MIAWRVSRVRNSIILIDFIERIRARADVTLAEALIEAGAIRCGADIPDCRSAMFGALLIIWTRYFRLAWSFIFGIFASTLFSCW